MVAIDFVDKFNNLDSFTQISNSVKALNFEYV